MRALLLACLAALASGYDVTLAALTDGAKRYIIASFPSLMIINYLKPGDTTWYPLINSGLAVPTALAVDSHNNRLYVVDGGVGKVLMFQLLVLGDGTMISDGNQHVAVQNVAVKGILLTNTGDLYMAGNRIVLPPLVANDAIFLQSAPMLLTSFTTKQPADPLEIWSNANPGGNTFGRLNTPVGVGLDSFNMFWANGASGSEKGAIVKAPKAPPPNVGAGSMSVLADNADAITTFTMTATDIFYGTADGIFGVSKTMASPTCSPTECVLITDQIKAPSVMFWDGDGSIYVADPATAAIYTFPSGTVAPHLVDKINSAPGLSHCGVLHLGLGSGAPAAGLSALAALAAALGGWAAAL